MSAKQERKARAINELLAYNKRILYKLSDKYQRLDALNWYIGTDSALTRTPYLRETLLAVYRFIEDKQLWWLSSDGFVFFVDTARLTHKVRGKSCGYATSNHHINLLCAIGLFEKLNQDATDSDYERMLKPILKPKDKKRPVNAFMIRKYDAAALEEMERRAKLLRAAKVTSGNLSYNYLCINASEAIANEIYYANSKAAPDKKRREWLDLRAVIDFMLEEQGYTNKEQIKSNSVLTDREIDKLFVIYKETLRTEYNYKQPTAQQMLDYGLSNRHWIITERTRTAADIGNNGSRRITN